VLDFDDSYRSLKRVTLGDNIDGITVLLLHVNPGRLIKYDITK